MVMPKKSPAAGRPEFVPMNLFFDLVQAVGTVEAAAIAALDSDRAQMTARMDRIGDKLDELIRGIVGPVPNRDPVTWANLRALIAGHLRIILAELEAK